MSPWPDEARDASITGLGSVVFSRWGGQSNLSQSVMGPLDYVNHLNDKRPTIAQVFDEYIPAGVEHGSPRPIDLDNVIVRNAGYWSNSTLDLVPSRLELSRTLKNPTGKERRLAKALARIGDRYDLVLIDCAPTESILTDAAYFAAREGTPLGQTSYAHY